MEKVKINGSVFYREASIEKKLSKRSEGSRDSYIVSFSSDTELDRGFYIEKLNHLPGSIRMDRMNQGGAVLWNHNPDDQRGVVNRFWLDYNKSKAEIRFSPNPAGQELKADVDAGIKKNTSVGYIIHNSRLAGSRDGKDIIEAIDWEPIEVSFVSIAADASIGIGRSLTVGEKAMDEKEKKTTSPERDNIKVTDSVEQIRNDEKARIKEIRGIGVQFRNLEDIQTMVDKAIQDGTSKEAFQQEILKKLGDLQEQGVPIRSVGADIGMTPKEIKQYNICRAIMAYADGQFEKAGLEHEAHQAVMRQFKLDPKNGGFFVPFDIQQTNYGEQMTRPEMNRFLSKRSLSPYQQNLLRNVNRRDMLAGVFSQGGAVVPTELLVGSMIELLRNNMVMMQVGTQMLTGLVGNILIPKKTGASTAYWVNEAEAITESTPALGQVGMTMKTVGALADFSWDLLKQTSLDVQSFVISDLTETLAIEADRVILNGSGVNGQPRGILNTSGIGSVNGGNLSWADIVEFLTDVRTANVRGEDLAWITNAAVEGITLTRNKEPGYPVYLNNGDGTMLGHPVWVTEQMPASTLLFGQYSQGIVGQWGVLEVVAENITQLPNRIIRVVAFMAMDYVIRQVVAFSAADANVT